MAQDTALLRYLLRRWHWWSWWGRDLAFAFDWVNDYISSNATIGRTGYDMNVSGNVTTGSDGDGSYIQINWNRTGWVWTKANIWPTATPSYTQATSFSFKAKIKFNSLAVANVSWVFGADIDASIYYDFTTNAIRRVLRGSTTVAVWALGTATTWVVYDAYFVYDHTVTKFYCYLSTSWASSVLQNTWGTTWPTTFTTSNWYLWDDWTWAWTAESCNKQIYHACIRNKALTQAEVDADIALWNTTKQDPSIVAYYIPENLQYNTQYIANPKALDNASWIKAIWCTVTANTTVAPDWTNTADQVVWTWISTDVSKLDVINTNISWATIASKTFIVKAFVKVGAGTAAFRLKCTHWWVADYLSSNLTATTTRQEFTFTKTFTSSTSGSWVIWWLVTDTTNTAATLEVRNVRLFLVNETLRDESPNIGGYLWWKTQKVLSCRVKPWADTISTADAWALMIWPWQYMHIRWSTLQVQIRYDDRVTSHASMYNLWTWFRGKAHLLWVYYRNWTVWSTKLYINWIIQDSDSFTVDVPNNAVNTLLWSWRKWNTYYQGNIRDVRIYTFTGSFTDSDAMAIYNGWEPISPWITKYLHYKPPVGEVWATTEDLTPNNRDGILNGGVTREYI